ncbi:hypothetical protein Q7I34_18855, partial [Aeromonas veronii]|uniref:hypothetical protein n=1 Tax=Aeromonas veronii TaxID=654 RepID=UPI0030072AB1
RQGATVDQGMIVSLFPVNAIWVNSYLKTALRDNYLEKRRLTLALSQRERGSSSIRDMALTMACEATEQNLPSPLAGEGSGMRGRKKEISR